MTVIDITNETFGYLFVVRRVTNDKYDNARWLCKCKCGKEIIAKGYSLRSGHTKSCGCLQKEKASILSTRHGLCKKNSTNKMKKLLSVYNGMKSRCYSKSNEEYSYYGGRGIGICKEWKNPRAFYEWAINNGYEENLTIDRIDNNSSYSPENCRFVSRAEQNRNTSRTNMVITENPNKKITTAQVARIIGVDRATTAKWFRLEGLRTINQFKERAKRIKNKKNMGERK